MEKFIEGKGGKHWSPTVIRSGGKLIATASEGDLKNERGFVSFSYEMFGARRVEIPLAAKRLTEKVRAEAYAMLEAEIAKVPALEAPREGENPEPAQYQVVGAGPIGLLNRNELEAAHGAPAGLSNWQGVLRSELKGRPRFNHLCGPMWGGVDQHTGLPIVRYETAEANAALSA